MSVDTSAADLLLTQCLRCGATRTVKRAAGRRANLTCEACHRQTPHRPFGRENDWREENNAQGNDDLRKLVRMVDRLNALSWILVARRDATHALRVCRYEDEEEAFWWVVLDEKQPLNDQIDYLHRAVRMILTADFDGPLCSDSADRPYRGYQFDARPGSR